MKVSLLKEFERLFKRTAFKAVEDIATLTANEQQWFVWVHRAKETPGLLLEQVDEFTPKELGEAVADFFDAPPASTPS